jgi:hypothetical protein
MAQQSIVGVYDTLSQAEDAVRTLNAAGFPIQQVSILARDLTSERQVNGFLTTGDLATEGVTTGAWLGGLFGLLVGAAFIWVPGFGPLIVAGPLAAAIAGGVEGAVVGATGGGLLGALIGWGVSRDQVLKYEEHLKGGQYLLVAHGTDDQVAQAGDLLRAMPTGQISQHRVDDQNAAVPAA